MSLDVLSALRGLLSFVALTEFTNALRCFLRFDPDSNSGSISYIQSKLFSGTLLDDTSAKLVSDVFGLYCVLNGLVLIHLAIFSNYRPLMSLSACVLTTKLIFLTVHAFWFGTITVGRELVFPLMACVVSLVAVLVMPFCADNDMKVFLQDENEQLVKQMHWGQNRKNRRNKVD